MSALSSLLNNLSKADDWTVSGKKWVDKNRNCILAVSMSVNEPVSSSCLLGVHMVNGLVNKKNKIKQL